MRTNIKKFDEARNKLVKNDVYKTVNKEVTNLIERLGKKGYLPNEVLIILELAKNKVQEFTEYGNSNN